MGNCGGPERGIRRGRIFADERFDVISTIVQFMYYL
jgi:hypothetical protein